MSNIKTTDWFDGAKFVPAHVGLYEVVQEGLWQWWDGKFWYAISAVKSRASRSDFISCFQSNKWRGIKK